MVAASHKFTRGEPLLTGAPNGAEYRLHILMELWRLPYGDAPASDTGQASDRKATGSAYFPSGSELRPYLNFARAVLILVARVQ